MRHVLFLCLLSAVVVAAASSCSDDTSGSSSASSSSSSSSSGGSGGAGGHGGGVGGSGGDIFGVGGMGPANDFPAAPVVGPGLPADIADQFHNATVNPSGGPCLSEPALGAMVPRNWTPLLFEWSAPAPQTVFELKLEVDNQVNPLVIYTTDVAYTIDATVWDGLAQNSAGHDVQVSIRGAAFDGTALTGEVQQGVVGEVHLAPVDAPGSVVYWSSSAGTAFKGFTIGDTTYKTILTPATAGMTSAGGSTTCVSCHTSSPDGKLLIYSRDATDNSRAIDVRNIDGTVVDAATVSPAALALLNRHKQTVPLTSLAHYSPSDAIALSVYASATDTNNHYELIWTDLHATDATGWGIIARNGDPRNVSSPSWSHDGTRIAYVSSAGGGEGVVANTTSSDPTMDIYTVPYNNKSGGTATPLVGASDPNLHEFYPVYSPNDTLLAFNRTSELVHSYNQPSAELFVMPALGGTAVRLSANDPPSCTNVTSPGLTNSWARWAPKSETVGTSNYYWVVFSSRRRAGSGNKPQLYIAAIVTETANGSETLVAEYPAIYVTAQDPQENNHTPAWDVFEVEQLPPN